MLAPIGLRLSEDKTRICHIDEGFDFLGFRIQRQPKRGSGKPTVYTYPSKKSLARVKAKVRSMTQRDHHQPLAVLLYRLAPVVRGWVNYFRHGVSKATFDYLRAFTWRRVITLAAPQAPPRHLEVAPSPLPSTVVADGRGRAAVRPDDGPGHPLPLSGQHPLTLADRGLTHRHGHVESRMRGNTHVRFGERPGETDRRQPGTAPQADSTTNASTARSAAAPTSSASSPTATP